MSDWKFAMLLILPLMLAPARLRVWVAMMAGSVAALYVPQGLPEEAVVSLYIPIDIAVGAVILAHPRGDWQRALGSLSVGMIGLSVGYLGEMVLIGRHNPDFYWRIMMVLSWTRFALLFAWGAYDVAELAVHRLWPFRHAPAAGIDP